MTSQQDCKINRGIYW